jgi:hypothetical protein
VLIVFHSVWVRVLLVTRRPKGILAITSAVTLETQKSRHIVDNKVPAFLAHQSRAELKAMGKALRDKCSRVSHAKWKPARDRPDPVRLVLKADEGRLRDLLPLRHGRMALSPFTFYRGSALAMAVDLAGTPSTGFRVQCGGDSHLVNFRGLATPERQVILAINDLDETLPAPWEWDHRMLLDRYELKDAALKVVGVGSVGTLCWVLLLMDGGGDPLLLQVKEARASVLEAYAGKSVFPNHGQRVVSGHRLMQPASDIFLGWVAGSRGRHYYVRQLRDVKIKFAVETFQAAEMTLFAQWCGYSLALSHVRSGDPAVISGYLGKNDTFDKAIATFSISYAYQNEKDHAALKRAIRNGKVEAVFEEAK